MPMQFGFITARIILPLLLCYPTNFLNFPFSFSIIAVCFFTTLSENHASAQNISVPTIQYSRLLSMWVEA